MSSVESGYQSECPACSHRAYWDGQTKEEEDNWFFFHMRCSFCSNAFWQSAYRWEREYRAGRAPQLTQRPVAPPEPEASPPAADPARGTGEEESFDDLRATALGSADIPERRFAIERLAQLGDPRAVEVLELLLRASGPTIGGDRGIAGALRLDVIKALGELGHAKAIQPLVEVLAWPDRNHREAAATALGKIGDPSAIRPLVAALSDPDEWVRRATAASLGNIGHPSAVVPLRQLLTDPSEWVRPRAAIALGEMGDPSALEALLDALGHEDHGIRAEAAAALGVVGEPRAAEALIAVARDSGTYYGARSNAAVALACMGDSRALPVLQEMVEHGVGFLAPAEAAARLRRWIASIERDGVGSRLVPCPACGDPARCSGAIEKREGWLSFELPCPSCHYRFWKYHLQGQREHGP